MRAKRKIAIRPNNSTCVGAIRSPLSDQARDCVSVLAFDNPTDRTGRAAGRETDISRRAEERICFECNQNSHFMTFIPGQHLRKSHKGAKTGFISTDMRGPTDRLWRTRSAGTDISHSHNQRYNRTTRNRVVHTARLLTRLGSSMRTLSSRKERFSKKIVVLT
jgi:hypothetical protein